MYHKIVHFKEKLIKIQKCDEFILAVASDFVATIFRVETVQAEKGNFVEAADWFEMLVVSLEASMGPAWEFEAVEVVP